MTECRGQRRRRDQRGRPDFCLRKWQDTDDQENSSPAEPLDERVGVMSHGAYELIFLVLSLRCLCDIKWGLTGSYSYEPEAWENAWILDVTCGNYQPPWEWCWGAQACKVWAEERRLWKQRRKGQRFIRRKQKIKYSAQRLQESRFTRRKKISRLSIAEISNSQGSTTILFHYWETATSFDAFLTFEKYYGPRNAGVNNQRAVKICKHFEKNIYLLM